VDSCAKPNYFEKRLKIDTHAAILQPTYGALLDELGVHLSIKRDDRLHPIISGNKWRKLSGAFFNLHNAGLPIWTMGGPWSNFLHTFGYIGYSLDWTQAFFVRFHQGQTVTETLRDLSRWQRRQHHVSRQEFAALRQIKPGTYRTETFLNQLPRSLAERIDADVDLHASGEHLWVAEGGEQRWALNGYAALAEELGVEFDWVVCASATGLSVAGLAQAFAQLGCKSKVLGVAVLNNVAEQRNKIRQWLDKPLDNWQIIDGFQQGGFAKTSAALMQWIARFNRGAADFAPTGEPRCVVEPVYTGKSFYATAQLLHSGFFKSGSRICLLHCGGLQGARGRRQR